MSAKVSEYLKYQMISAKVSEYLKYQLISAKVSILNVSQG